MEYTVYRDRKIYLDVLRIIAIFFVVFNHTGTRGFFLFSVTENPYTYWVYLFLSILCKVAVPLFFMVSGSLILSKNESISLLYYKRVLKYTMVLIIFSLYWYISSISWDYTKFSLSEFLTKIYSINIIVPYWFLYSYLAALIMLPFIRRMAQGMSKKEFVYLLILQVMFSGILPAIQYLFFDDKYKIFISLQIVTTTSIFFMLMGYFFENKLIINQSNKKKITFIIVLFGAISLLIACGLTHLKAVKTGEFSESFYNSFIALPTIAIFYITKEIVNRFKANKSLQKVIISISECTFGIYLFEEYFRNKLNFIYEALLPYLHCMLSSYIYIFCVIICGYILTVVLKRIPYINKLF